MTIATRFEELTEEITEWRRDLHAHPELLYEVQRTAKFVENKLESFGVDEIVTNIGKTGLVGIVKGRQTESGRVIGLRADMDALPIQEETGLAYASTNDGLMHACGHDGHTAMLLGVAKYFTETRNFDGTIVLIFQPAEEGGAGGKAMVDDGLMERFGIQEVFGMHNKPGLPFGQFSIRPGKMMAASDTFTVKITGQGGHAAYPHNTVDATLVASHVAVMLQSIVSRNVNPVDAAVLSVTSIHAGDAFNVIPETAILRGTVRTLDAPTRDQVEARLKETAEFTSRAMNAVASVDYQRSYPVLVNNSDKARFAADVAAGIAGEDFLDRNTDPVMGGEDFAFMLEAKPGAFIFVGTGEDRAALHRSKYDFNDEIIPTGCAYWAGLAESAMPI